MKNFWRTFFKTLEPVALICTIVCGFHAFCMDMWLFHIEAPCQFFVVCGKLFYGFDLSFVAAYVFYLMTVHYPETKKKKLIYAASDFPAMAIVTNIEMMFVDMAKKQGQEITHKDLNGERIIEILSSTQCNAPSTMNHILSQDVDNFKSKPINWIDYIRDRENLWRSYIAEVRPLFSQLDSEYISAVTNIDQCKFSTPITAMVSLAISLNGKNGMLMTFSNGLERFFLDIYDKSQVLRGIVEKRRAIYDSFSGEGK